jgi:hypothetical protein
VRHNCAFAKRYIAWLDGELAGGEWLAGSERDRERQAAYWRWLYDARQEAYDLWWWGWDDLRLAQLGGEPGEAARQRLRCRLGEENFRAGWMPPPVPVWRFRRIE